MTSGDGDRLWSLVARDARGHGSFATLSEKFNTGAGSDAVNRGRQIAAELPGGHGVPATSWRSWIR